MLDWRALPPLGLEQIYSGFYVDSCFTCDYGVTTSKSIKDTTYLRKCRSCRVNSRWKATNFIELGRGVKNKLRVELSFESTLLTSSQRLQAYFRRNLLSMLLMGFECFGVVNH